MARVASTFVALALLASLAACGGSDFSGAGGEHPAAARAAAIAAQQKPTTVTPIVEEPEVLNERWEHLAEHFGRFALRPPSSQKDVFKSRLDKFVPDEILHGKIAEDGATETEQKPEDYKADDTPPLKRFAADEFKVVIIMTGTGIPKALLMDPKGVTHDVTVDDAVGNEDGVVVSITQHEVVIRHSDAKPVRLNLRPQLFEVVERQDQERELLE